MIEKYKELITKYIKAKDANKPYLMEKVFEEESKLEIILNSQNISFPSQTLGLEKITEVLIKNFNTQYENIYTICFEDSINIQEDSLSCLWFVFMSEKTSGKIRLGYGSYLWQFKDLVSKLDITIESMNIFEKENKEIYSCISKLSYPWSNSKDFISSLHNYKILSDIKKDFEIYSQK